VTTIVVGIEDSLRGEDAIALAGDVARAGDADVLAVCAYPFDARPAAHYNAAMRATLREQASAMLDRLCEPLSDLTGVRRIAIADPSPARALLAAAAASDAALIVVGSSHAGHDGHVRPGSTAWRLLQGAPCSVALAPQGHRLRPHLPGGRVTVAFDGSRGAWAALAAGAPLARAWERSLRVVTVFAPEPPTSPWTHVPPGFIRITPDAERAARASLERAAAAVEGAQAAFLVGDPARELARESQVSDLIVTGSRGYGPEPAVLLGGVSGRLLETAACPVLIVPNGAAVPLGGLGKLRTQAAA
jgi:nucleotide-binding universal stress UspA family protein